MTKIYLTRHGETLWNIQKRMQGWNDSPLTQKGIIQAKLLEKRLSNIEFSAIYTSPLGRAKATATIIKGTRNIPMIESEKLKEINLGLWEGLSAEEIENIDKDQQYNFWNKPQLYKPNTGETFQDVNKRTMEFVMEAIETHKDTNILIVTHAVAVKSIMSYFEDRPLDKFWDSPFIQQTSLSIIEEENGHYKITAYADTEHINEEHESRIVNAV